MRICKHGKQPWGTNRRKWGTNLIGSCALMSQRLPGEPGRKVCLTKTTSLRLIKASSLSLTNYKSIKGYLTEATSLISTLRLPHWVDFFRPFWRPFSAAFEEPLKILKLCLRNPITKFSCLLITSSFLVFCTRAFQDNYNLKETTNPLYFMIVLHGKNIDNVCSVYF
jgi:hypothetical protein